MLPPLNCHPHSKTVYMCKRVKGNGVWQKLNKYVFQILAWHLIAAALRAILHQTGLQNQSQRPQKTFHRCLHFSGPAMVEFYVEDHLQVIFIKCIPVGPGRGQRDE